MTRIVSFGGAAAIAFAGILSASAARAECGGELATFRSIIDSDVQTGNVNKSVYNRMVPEVARLTQLCRSGHDAEAVRGLHALKSRYGYR